MLPMSILTPFSVRLVRIVVCSGVCLTVAGLAHGQSDATSQPATATQRPPRSATAVSDPNRKEIPVPEIRTELGVLPGVDQLPIHKNIPDPLILNDGSRVTTADQWPKRREEIKRIIEYYDTGLAPPPPGNVRGEVVKSETKADGTKYRLIHLTFGPDSSLFLNVGIYEPAGDGPFPALITAGPTPEGAPVLPTLPNGPTQGHAQDALLFVGGGVPARATSRPSAATSEAGPRGRTQPYLNVVKHGFAYVVYNTNDCAEDTTLREMDGTFSFRTTRFFPAYPNYDWGVLMGWAWGASRIVDYLENDPSIDHAKIAMTGVSRAGKSALFAAAFDERITLAAPVASSGGGTPAFRFSGAGRGGHEGLDEELRKYPNWFSPHLHEFIGHQDQLPFDNNWLLALCAPRVCIALEGEHDQNVSHNGVRESLNSARSVYTLLGATDKLGINWAVRPHGEVQDDWDALFAFADKWWFKKPVTRAFDLYSEEPAADGKSGAATRPAE